MLKTPLVSVVIATYNMGKFLPEAMDSALNQTYENIEVIVIDDGSSDDTKEVIKSYLTDTRVRYIVQENKGQSSAKNKGICESRGEYVAFLDADDIWVPEKLEMQIPVFAKAKNIGIVYARMLYIDETGRGIRILNTELFRGQISSQLFVCNFVGFGTAVVKRECFDRLGGFREEIRMGIDYELWLRFSTQYEFDYVDCPLLRYRVWGGQMSSNWKGRYLSGIQIMEKFLIEFPNAIDANTQKMAWAYTYVGFGHCMQSIGNDIGGALSLYFRALRYKPNYLPAWVAILKVIARIGKFAHS